MQISRNTKAFLSLYLIFNIICSSIYFWIIHLPTFGDGNYYSDSLQHVFSGQMVDMIGVVMLIGWVMMGVFILQKIRDYHKRSHKKDKSYKKTR